MGFLGALLKWQGLKRLAPESPAIGGLMGQAPPMAAVSRGSGGLVPLLPQAGAAAVDDLEEGRRFEHVNRLRHGRLYERLLRGGRPSAAGVSSCWFVFCVVAHISSLVSRPFVKVRRG